MSKSLYLCQARLKPGRVARVQHALQGPDRVRGLRPSGGPPLARGQRLVRGQGQLDDMTHLDRVYPDASALAELLQLIERRHGRLGPRRHDADGAARSPPDERVAQRCPMGHPGHNRSKVGVSGPDGVDDLGIEVRDDVGCLKPQIGHNIGSQVR